MASSSKDIDSIESCEIIENVEENVRMERNNLHGNYQRREARTSTILYNCTNSEYIHPNEVNLKKTRRSQRRQRNRTPKKIPNNVINTPNMKVQNVLSNDVDSKLPNLNPSTSRCTPVIQKQTNLKDTNDELINIEYNFTIKPIEAPTVGYFIKKRNPRCKYIHLKSFIKDTNQLSCTFVSELSNVIDKCEKLFISDKKTMTKCQLRKFNYDMQQNERSSAQHIKRTKKEKKPNKIEAKFEDYIDSEAIAEGLEIGELIKGFMRINPKSFKDAYVSNEDTSIADYYLTSVADRNKALEGDEVVLRIKPEDDWIDGKKTAKVVHITKLIHPRVSIGVLKPMEKRSEFAVFYPRDKRIPIMRIPSVSWPNGFKSNPKLYEKVLFVAKIVEWKVPNYAMGILIENLGITGDLGVETMSILREFNLDTTPFSSDVIESLPLSEEIPQKEFEYREDLRKQCVFTIDPPTARDLDDAVSVRELPNGNYEIGVHISDASFYLEEGTELDQLVSRKATTIYLVEKAYHMLPVELCLFCSLLPGKDRLSFSVFWEITKDAEIVSKRFTRSIMNSCTQLAYDHAQMFIENPDQDFKDEDFPPIHNGFSVNDLKKTVSILQAIAVKLRERRIQNGALKIDKVKLLFKLNPQNSEPLEFWKYENKESHRLIEEFMLLANISVAEKISQNFPDIAFLRCHEPPKQTMLVELQNNLATCGIHIDISSSGGIRASMSKYITEDFPGQCRAAVLNHITAKAMTRARYFCAATMESDEDYKHYALSVPIYTHFTSPIRRYADIMVHRLLAASLNYRDKPEWDIDYVNAIAANCNTQKYNAKRAGEASCDLYLAHYVEQNQPFEKNCVVVDVKDRSFDAIVLETGSIIRIYQNTCEEGTRWNSESIPLVGEQVSEASNEKRPKKENEKKLYRLIITFPKTKSFPKTKLIVEMFTLVKVNLTRHNSYKLEGTLLRPITTQTFSSNKT